MDLTNVLVSDTLPAALTSVTWTSVGSAGVTDNDPSGSGDIDDTVTFIPAGGTVTYTLTGTIDPAATGTLSNTATVSPPAGTTDPDPANNSATDTDTLTPQADLSITKTDGVTTAVPGTQNTYTIVVSNTGPSDATNVLVADTVPAALTGVTWTSVGSAGVTGNDPSGSGDINDTVTFIPVGGTVTYTLTGTIDPAATGTLSNTATVSPPAGVTDPDLANSSATDTDTLTPSADLSITKDDGVATVVPGTSTTYIIVVSNQGPSIVSGASVSDPLPAGVITATWTATASSGGGLVTGSSSATGALASTVDLPVGASVTFTFTVLVSPSATGTLSNTATVSPPAGTTDPDPANNSATDTDSLTPQADLSITKTDGVTSVIPGTSTTYTIVVSNAGPSTAADQAVTDVFSSAITAVSWTATASAGSSVAAASGAGNINTTVTLLPGGTVTFTAVAQISPDAQSEVVSLVNTASVAVPPGDTTPDNNSATDIDSLTPLAGLSITKDDGQTTAVPGQSTSYTITVSNAGPSAANGVALSDPLPAGVTSAAWTFVSATGGGSVTGPPSGTGDLATTVNLPVGATITFTFTVQIDPSATGSLVNTATVTPPGGTPIGATDTDSLTPEADLAVAKTDGQTSAVPGTPVTYTIVVSSQGPSTVSSLTLTDAVPAALLNPSFGAPSAGSYDPATGVWSGLSLAQGQSVSITLTGTIDPAATDTLTNTAHVSPPAGTADPDPANNSATDTDTLTPSADLSIIKDDGVATVVPGTQNTYTIVVSNTGPGTAVDQAVNDLFPAAITAVNWTATASAGSSVAATNGTGNIVTTVTLLPGGTVTFTAVAQVDPAATGTLSNTATVAVPPGDNTPGDNTATDTDTLTPQADLSITKDDGVTSVVPGTQNTYTIVVTNSGTSDVKGASVSDPLPAGVSSATWTATASSGGGTVTGPSSGTGALATIVDLPAGASVTFTFTVLVSPSATGRLGNTATVSPPVGVTDPDPANNSATDTDTLTPLADLSITKTDGVTSVVPGTSTTYTIMVRNQGPSTVSGANVSDPLPAGVITATWTATASSGGGVVTGPSSGTGALATTVNLPAGASVTFTFTVLVSPSATDTLNNTATVSPPAGVTDPDPTNNSATDTDTLTQALSSLSGSVYVDHNNNGFRDAGEVGIPGVTVRLTGIDITGAAVNATVVTDANGNYHFTQMLPGTYTLTEVQPTEFVDGIDSAGTAGGSVSNDVIAGIALGPNQFATGYQFGEKGLAVVSKRPLIFPTPPEIKRVPGSGITEVNP